MKPSLKDIIGNWINERIPVAQFINQGLHEEIVGGTRFSYTLGSSCLFLLIIQIVTGLWHMFFYVPTIDYAYSSLSYLRFEVPFGWLIHGMHYWGAHLFTIVVGLHMMRVFIWGAYKKPREIVWLAGVFLVLMVVGFMFTGPVLAWDKKGFWAGQVGLGIAGSVPIVGPWTQQMLQGASEMGQIALTRLFVIHVAIIPMLTMLFVTIHLIAFRQHLSVGPWDEKKRKTKGEFWPEQLFKDIVVWLGIFILLVGLCAFFPPEVTGKADPMDTHYPPKPEWSFFFLYEIIKYFPGPFLPIGTAGIPTLILLAFLSLPFLDRSPERNPFKRGFVVLTFLAFVAAVLVFTWLGYKSHPPAPEVIAIMEEDSKDQHSVKHNKKHQREEYIELVKQVNADENITGEKLYNRLGCTECHNINGKPSSKQGPDLLLSKANNRSTEWMKLQLKYPQEHNPNTIMPPYAHLSEKNINMLVDYLAGLTPPKEEAVEVVAKAVISNVAGDASALAQQGENVFNAQGCIQCHTIKGRKGMKSGPDLILALKENSRDKEWLKKQIIAPQEHNPTTIMPSYANRMDENQINAVVEFLITLPSRKIVEPTADEKAEEGTQQEYGTGVGEAASIIGNKHHGSVLYQQACIQCHGPQGKTDAINHKKEKGVPSLNPIREGLYSDDPATFAQKIDVFIQHGIPNREGGPNMPAFGDLHGLTQAQIADIEAYVMHLNGVDRAKILNPGIEPKDFFWIVFNLSVVIMFLSVLYWIVMRKKF